MPDLKQLVKTINKAHGKNAIRLGATIKEQMSYKISTGSVALDYVIGGGIPSGRLITIAGAYSTGKSLLAYKMIANVQKMKKKLVTVDGEDIEIVAEDGDIPLTCALIQTEQGSLTKEWAIENGIDLESLLFCQPDGMEEALDIAIALQRAGVELIVIDSYAALLPTKVLTSDFDESYQMGIKPKMLGEYHGKFQLFNNALEREGKLPSTVVAINQLREKIGVMYGSPEYTTGGRSTGFTNTLEIRLRMGDTIAVGSGETKRIVGKTIKFRIEKNKAGVPYGTGEYDIYTDTCDYIQRGDIDNEKALIMIAVLLGIVERRGVWYYYNGEQLSQGQDNLIKLLRSNRALFEEIREKVLTSDEHIQ